MVNDTWKIRWREFIYDSYVYGSKISFRNDGTVAYENELVPPGTVLHTWKSRTNFQINRVEPSLPLIDGEAPYMVTLNLKDEDKLQSSLMLRIVFFDRYDNQVSSLVIREKTSYFKPPIQTFSYNIELINGGNANFIFDSLVIKEVSKEDFDAEQKRIQQNKENIKKGKKKRA